MKPVAIPAALGIGAREPVQIVNPDNRPSLADSAVFLQLPVPETRLRHHCSGHAVLAPRIGTPLTQAVEIFRVEVKAGCLIAVAVLRCVWIRSKIDARPFADASRAAWIDEKLNLVGGFPDLIHARSFHNSLHGAAPTNRLASAILVLRISRSGYKNSLITKSCEVCRGIQHKFADILSLYGSLTVAAQNDAAYIAATARERYVRGKVRPLNS
jgi:hypothetical protein